MHCVVHALSGGGLPPLSFDPGVSGVHPSSEALPFSSSFGALGHKVLVAATVAAGHHSTTPIPGVLSSTKALARRVLSFSFALEGEEGLDIGEHEGTSVLAAAFALVEVAESSTEAAHWLALVPAPHLLRSSIGHVDVLGGIRLGVLVEVLLGVGLLVAVGRCARRTFEVHIVDHVGNRGAGLCSEGNVRCREPLLAVALPLVE